MLVKLRGTLQLFCQADEPQILQQEKNKSESITHQWLVMKRKVKISICIQYFLSIIHAWLSLLAHNI